MDVSIKVEKPIENAQWKAIKQWQADTTRRLDKILEVLGSADETQIAEIAAGIRQQRERIEAAVTGQGNPSAE